MAIIGDGTVEIEVDPGQGFDSVISALGQANATFQEKLVQGLEDTAPATEADVRAAALELPAHGRRHTGLRARLAASVEVDTHDNGITFVSKMATSGLESVAKGEDNGIKGWRHPVFGDRSNWVTEPGGAWFSSVIQRHGPDMSDKLQDVIQNVADQIAEAGHL